MSWGARLAAGCSVLYAKVKVKSLSRVWLFATRWTVAHQAPPSMGFSRQECWSALPFPSPARICAPPKKQRRHCRHGRREYSEFAARPLRQPGGNKRVCSPMAPWVSLQAPCPCLAHHGFSEQCAQWDTVRPQEQEEKKHTRPVCPLLCLLWIPTLPAPLVSQTSKFSWQRRRKIAQHCLWFLLTASQRINSSWESGEIHFRESVSYDVQWVFSLWLKCIIQCFILVWNVLEKCLQQKKHFCLKR